MRVALINPNWDFAGSIYFGCREPHLPLEYGYARALLAPTRIYIKTVLPPLHGALFKNEQDVHMLERLAFLAKREGR